MRIVRANQVSAVQQAEFGLAEQLGDHPRHRSGDRHPAVHCSGRLMRHADQEDDEIAVERGVQAGGADHEGRRGERMPAAYVEG